MVMKTYIQSRGKGVAYDYSYLAVDGKPAREDVALLRVAEKSAPESGVVSSVARNSDGSRIALYLGNVDSGREDFQGRQIFTSLGLVYSKANVKDDEIAQALVKKWHSTEDLAKLVRDGVFFSKNAPGFMIAPNFEERLWEIANDEKPLPIKEQECKDNEVDALSKTGGTFCQETQTTIAPSEKPAIPQMHSGKIKDSTASGKGLVRKHCILTKRDVAFAFLGGVFVIALQVLCKGCLDGSRSRNNHLMELSGDGVRLLDVPNN